MGKLLNTGRTHFKKGHVPWNKGMKAKDNVVLASILDKAHNAVRGKTAWNKGILKPHFCKVCGNLVKRKNMQYSDTCSNVCLSQHRHNINKKLRIKPPSQKGKKWGIDYPIERHNWWHGGITPVRSQIWKSKEFQEWRESIFERDNYTCRLCGKRGGKLQVDHFPITFSKILRLRNIKSIEDAILCNDLWDINNGRTLCEKCHRLTPTYGTNYRYLNDKFVIKGVV